MTSYFLLTSDISIHASAKEATSLHMLIHLSYLDFNPRLREGGDGIQRHNRLEESKISIHASAKEATLILPEFFATFCISIHASAKEATSLKRVLVNQILFQSTPPRRRRPQHIVIPQLSCTYLVSTTFLSTFFSFISQYVVLFFLF